MTSFWCHDNLGSGKSSLFLCFGLIKLNFGARCNFRLLISNLKSKMQYQFAMLRKCHFYSIGSWFLAQHSLMNWLPWQQWVVYFQSFNFKNFYIWLSKTDISLVKITWTVFEISSQNPRRSAIFLAVSFWWRHKINMTMTPSKIVFNL